MSCPTCNHCMQLVVDNIFWCPRCGTLRYNNLTDTPRLINRVKKSVESIITDINSPSLIKISNPIKLIKEKLWSYGVIESILLPEDRKVFDPNVLP